VHERLRDGTSGACRCWTTRPMSVGRSLTSCFNL
jgi:hypothetical protein